MFRLLVVCVVPLLSLSVLVPTVAAGEIVHGKRPFEHCLQEVLETRSGMVIKVEMKEQRGMLVYEFDIRDNKAQDWDIECDADRGEIVEIEREVTTPMHPSFHSAGGLSEDEARRIALEAYSGEILEAEYEIEADGRAVYEFDIHRSDGIEMKVEIDAASGDLHETSRELWQIGYE